MRIYCDGIVREVNERDFSHFKQLGYVKMEEVSVDVPVDVKKEDVPSPELETVEVLQRESEHVDKEEAYLNMTVPEIKAELEKLGIDYRGVTLKADLLALLP